MRLAPAHILLSLAVTGALGVPVITDLGKTAMEHADLPRGVLDNLHGETAIPTGVPGHYKLGDLEYYRGHRIPDLTDEHKAKQQALLNEPGGATPLQYHTLYADAAASQLAEAKAKMDYLKGRRPFRFPSRWSLDELWLSTRSKERLFDTMSQAHSGERLKLMETPSESSQPHSGAG